MSQSRIAQAAYKSGALATAITRKASLQTYYTVRLLVDRERVANAYRAYAYFRWMDDWLDAEGRQPAERLQFIQRQSALIEACYQDQVPFEVTSEEEILVDLVRSDPSPRSGLAAYIHNLMAALTFDSGRRGRLITQSELNAYSHSLAIAVTEALHYFIGHDQASPRDGARYLSVTAAHITHMLRDTSEDLEAGYFNIPVEVLRSRQISAEDVGAPAYRDWVRSRVELARGYFRGGREFVSQLESVRRRIAYFAYISRFETVLDMIERDHWQLRPAYDERKSLRNALRMAWSVGRSVRGPRVPSEGIRVPGQD